MTEEQIRNLVREQILSNFFEKIQENKDPEKANFQTESDLRMLARSKLREAELKNKILKNEK